MTNAQTSNKAKRESIFRSFMALCTEHAMSADEARAAIAADLHTTPDVIAAGIDRVLLGR